MQNETEWLTAKEAALMLRKTTKTLANWRSKRLGPPAYKTGTVIEYRRSDIEQWLNENRRLITDDGEERRAS